MSNWHVSPSPLAQAKEKIDINTLWLALGLPGEPKKSCCSPFRDDHHPSFSISEDGRYFFDHGTGEGGDVITFIMRAKGCSPGDAARELIRLAGITPPQPKTRSKTLKSLRLPALTIPSVGDLAAIQRVRGWPCFAGLEIAAQRGLLHRCTMTDDGISRAAWAITDSARRSVQVRRMDGRPWTWNEAKAWTLGGSVAGWPIGAADIGDKRIVLFCEGGPDFLAAHDLAWLHRDAATVAVTCVPGANVTICPDALSFFAGKHVRIFEHADKAGHSAGQRWSAQLREAGATVDGFTLDTPFKDLADLFAATNADSLTCPVDIFEGISTQDFSCP